jgi:transcriptional regulator with XRE-family HTH domain
MSETLAPMIHDAPLKLIAGRIRRARREADLSLDRLGELAGTSRHHLIRLEKGIHRPRPEMLTRIAEATGRQVEWFLDPDLEPSPFQEAAA